MLPSQTLLRSPSTRILAELQRDIFALTKPLKYIEANFDAVSQTDDTEDDLVESELQASGSTALAILLQVRADICRGITREGRVVRGCQNFLSVCHAESAQEADCEVMLSFAQARHHDLGQELHLTNAFLATISIHRGEWRPADGDTVLQGLGKLVHQTAEASLPIIAPRRSSTRNSARTRASSRASNTATPTPSVMSMATTATSSAANGASDDIELLRLPTIVVPPKLAEPLQWRAKLERVLVNHYLEQPGAFARQIGQLQRARDMIAAAAVGPLDLSSSTPPKIRRAALDSLTHKLARHIKYYHNLCSLDERFFVDGRLAGMVFEWHDAFNGEHFHHTHLAYEKACTLFNAASVASQAAIEDCSHEEAAINKARTFHEIAAGLLELAYAQMEELESSLTPMARRSLRGQTADAALVKARASAAAQRRKTRPPPKERRKKRHGGKVLPTSSSTITLQVPSADPDELPQIISPDLSGKLLNFLIMLSLAQAQEEHWLMHCRRARSEGTVPYHDEAVAVFRMYKDVKAQLAAFKQDVDLPAAWFGTVYVKRDYYEACADWAHAQMLLHGDFEGAGISEEEVQDTACRRFMRSQLLLQRAIATCNDDAHGYLKIFVPHIERMQMLVFQEQRLCKVKSQASDDAIMSMPSLGGNPKRWSQPISLPHIKRPLDLFASLGRIHYFNALCPLMNRRTLDVHRLENGQLGFSIHGEKPVCIADVVQGSDALDAGVTPGSCILKVNGEDVRLKTHRYVADALVDSGPKVTIELVDNFAVEEAEQEDASLEDEEEFFDKLAQVGEEEIMNMLQDEIAMTRNRAQTM